jgi:hypothetical protein
VYCDHNILRMGPSGGGYQLTRARQMSSERLRLSSWTIRQVMGSAACPHERVTHIPLGENPNHQLLFQGEFESPPSPPETKSETDNLQNQSKRSGKDWFCPVSPRMIGPSAAEPGRWSVRISELVILTWGLHLDVTATVPERGSRLSPSPRR